jgi:hypothetical protein
MEKTANLWSEFVFLKKLSSSNFFFFSARKGVPWPCARLAHNCCGATFFLGNTSPAVSAGEVNKPR